jgi:hypothetical protein
MTCLQEERWHWRNVQGLLEIKKSWTFWASSGRGAFAEKVRNLIMLLCTCLCHYLCLLSTCACIPKRL